MDIREEPPDWDQLCATAHARELVQARRLSRNAGLPVAEALRNILTAVAQPGGLQELVTLRRQSRLDELVRRDRHHQEKAAAWHARQHQKLPDPAAWHGWFDGSAWPNPGRIGLGGVLRSPSGSIIEISIQAGHGDSNQAEYLALLALLEAALPLQPAALVIHGDSRIVIDDVTSLHEVPGLQTYRKLATSLIAILGEVRFQWIPRARNTSADALSQRARQT
ncbi:reverse transcriptase-like protein [Actimicrobium antarcticum]|uniref:RNase H type-1 domain-containing protein n=1 Tax=Actimicrobium antarcticum TaxID=1051899 RepID=A0ABP7T3N9_9BURK